MIASIHGVLEARRADSAIIRVGGFGLRIFTPSSTLSQLGEVGAEVTLHTHFQVREDGMALYGFSSAEERDAFEQLITVSGVGPKIALALLSTMDAGTFYRAIADEDITRLSLAPGVGKKLAGKLVFELKGKLPALAAAGRSGRHAIRQIADRGTRSPHGPGLLGCRSAGRDGKDSAGSSNDPRRANHLCLALICP